MYLSLPLPLLEVNVTEAKTAFDFSWFSETVPATEVSNRPVALVMTVGFNEESNVEVIDDSAAAGGNEDILAVGNIEEEAMLEATEAGTEVKANAVSVDFGLSILLSDMVDEL